MARPHSRVDLIRAVAGNEIARAFEHVSHSHAAKRARKGKRAEERERERTEGEGKMQAASPPCSRLFSAVLFLPPLFSVPPRVILPPCSPFFYLPRSFLSILSLSSPFHGERTTPSILPCCATFRSRKREKRPRRERRLRPDAPGSSLFLLDGRAVFSAREAL